MGDSIEDGGCSLSYADAAAFVDGANRVFQLAFCDQDERGTALSLEGRGLVLWQLIPASCRVLVGDEIAWPWEAEETVKMEPQGWDVGVLASEYWT